MLHAAGIQSPRALVLAYTARSKIRSATAELREHYPDVPIFARALDAAHAAELKAAGATDVFDATVEAGAAIGSGLLTRFGAKQTSLQVLISALRKQASQSLPRTNHRPRFRGSFEKAKVRILRSH